MNERQNKRLMHIIRLVHGLIENDDLKKQRDSQDQLGAFLVNDKKYRFTPVYVNEMHCEWTEYIQTEQKNDGSNVIFYCHGGGYMTGSCTYAREITTKLSRYGHYKVFSFDYRLAPEFPYPFAINDAFLAWKYLISCNFSPENIIFAGDSAGGNLCLALSLLLKQSNLQLPKCIILFSPWTDMTTSGKSYHSKELLDPVLNNKYIQKAKKCYLQDIPSTLPLVSPAFGDLSGLPPVYIQVGDNEILLDDSKLLYSRLLRYNVYSRLDIFPGLWHVFQMSPVKASMTAIDRVHKFINEINLDK